MLSLPAIISQIDVNKYPEEVTACWKTILLPNLGVDRISGNTIHSYQSAARLWIRMELTRIRHFKKDLYHQT